VYIGASCVILYGVPMGYRLTQFYHLIPPKKIIYLLCGIQLLTVIHLF